MIAKETISDLIKKHSSKPYSYSSGREISESDIETVSTEILDRVHKAEEEWEELAKLKTENAILRAQNEIYRAFLLSSNYKLPKESKAGAKGND